MAELRKYGVQTTIHFPLVDFGATDFEITPVAHAVGDTKIDKNEAGFGNTTNAFVHRGMGIYSIILTAAEMQAARIVVVIVDQTAPKAWEDQAVVVNTYGNAAAEHAFDLDTASQVVASVTAGVTLADDAITLSKFDEATAWPLVASDAGATQVARVGADGDTLETLSDEIAAVKGDTAAILLDTGANGVLLADDAITLSKFDEATAWPLVASDAGATQVARVGADGDTLEILSDEIAAVKGDTAAILTDTNELQTNQGNWVTAAGFSVHSAADAADAVWDELVAGHDGAGKAGQQLWTDVDAILDDTGTSGVIVSSLTAAALANLFTIDSGETFASSVGGSPVQETAGGVGATGSPHYLYVTKAGNDANGGLSWNDAKLTVGAAAAAASDGDTIHIGPGTFAESLDLVAVGPMLQVDLIGSGPTTILSGNVATRMLFLAGGCTVRDLQVVNANGAGTGIEINGTDNTLIDNVIVDSQDVGIKVTDAQNVRILNTTIYAQEYGINYSGAPTRGLESFRVEDCFIYLAGWVACDAGGIQTRADATIRRCLIWSEDSAGAGFGAEGVTVGGGASHVLVEDCLIVAKGLGATAAAWAIRNEGTGSINLLNSRVESSSASATAYDLSNESTGMLATGMSRYDSAKTQGTITIISPSVSLTAEDTRISIE